MSVTIISDWKFVEGKIPIMYELRTMPKGPFYFYPEENQAGICIVLGSNNQRENDKRVYISTYEKAIVDHMKKWEKNLEPLFDSGEDLIVDVQEDGHIVPIYNLTTKKVLIYLVEEAPVEPKKGAYSLVFDYMFNPWNITKYRLPILVCGNYTRDMLASKSSPVRYEQKKAVYDYLVWAGKISSAITTVTEQDALLVMIPELEFSLEEKDTARLGQLLRSYTKKEIQKTFLLEEKVVEKKEEIVDKKSKPDYTQTLTSALLSRPTVQQVTPLILDMADEYISKLGIISACIRPGGLFVFEVKQSKFSEDDFEKSLGLEKDSDYDIIFFADL